GLYRKLFEDQNEELVRRAADVTHKLVPAVPTISIFPTSELASLARLLTTESYPPGSVFHEQNGADGKLYLLRSGQVELVVYDEQGAGQKLQIGTPAENGGPATMSLLLNIPHSVSARALTETELQVLHDDDLRTLAVVVWCQTSPADQSDGVNGSRSTLLPRSALGHWAADLLRRPAD